MSEIHDLTALEQGAAIARGELTPADLAEHYASRTDDVGAYITPTPELGIEHAHRLTSQGRPEGAGPLWGVPTGIKDLHPTKGVRTTFGSAAFADHVPSFSDNIALTLEAAGMPSLGKTNTPEFGTPCYTEPDVAPPAVTPWDRSRIAGGSSGGAAAAVAAGVLPIAPGSDGGGSIRIPASCCGLVGLKPSRGRISPAPLYGDTAGLSTAGPIARTVRDAAALLDVLAGRRVGDPYWAPPPSAPFVDACERTPGRLRIARFIEPVIVETKIHESSRTAWERASQVLTDLGHEVEDIEVPLPREAMRTFSVAWSALAAISAPGDERAEQLRPITRWLVARGSQTSGPELAQAIGHLRRHAADALTRLAPFDAVLTPTLAQLPPPVGALRDDEDPARDFAQQSAFTPYTSAWNVTGMPAISLPLHRHDGLPVGVMLAGRPAEEELLLSLAAQVEDSLPPTPVAWAKGVSGRSE
ncbi:amidase [Marihabitans asiaticum]|uniref:amidase n=1 Tax=Marihabitans asiaticum TaxID=415218 RepID=UPI001B87BFC9|nr:amidase [Marihabitans asiaticum]